MSGSMDRLISLVLALRERQRREQAVAEQGDARKQFFDNLKANLSSYSIPGTGGRQETVPVERERFGSSPEQDVTTRTVPGTPDQQVQYLSLPGFLTALSGMSGKLAGSVDPSLVGFGNYADAARGSATLGEMLERSAQTQRDLAAGKDIGAAIDASGEYGSSILSALARAGEGKTAASLFPGFSGSGLNRQQFDFDRNEKWPVQRYATMEGLGMDRARLGLQQQELGLRRAAMMQRGQGGGPDPMLQALRKQNLIRAYRENDPAYISQVYLDKQFGNAMKSKRWERLPDEEKVLQITRMVDAAVQSGYSGYNDATKEEKEKVRNALIDSYAAGEGIQLELNKEGKLVYKKPKGIVESGWNAITGKDTRDAIWEEVK